MPYALLALVLVILDQVVKYLVLTGTQTHTTCVASYNGVWVMTIWADNMPIWAKTFSSNNYYWKD